ncbi:hypothetical protein [Streptomyces antimicrobicus]|uniref:Secreted protein n=1 Tax=Streptomyces antimicrobicus TaxID=2883108 RepID=A0ABS8B352_9ACTN|nr:hypothetical protein [Streptomyces antimicrobicus]MCB5179016.1 hypothetical protein [Streptomyces antimicrobicus]
MPKRSVLALALAATALSALGALGAVAGPGRGGDVLAGDEAPRLPVVLVPTTPTVTGTGQLHDPTDTSWGG